MPTISSPDWKDVVRGKHLIFDTDAIISLIAFDAEDVFSELKELGVSFNYTHPVLLELMATGGEREKLKRSTILSDYDFNMLPMTNTERDFAVQIQNSRPLGYKGNPSAADYYIGATLAKLANSNSYLLTSNIKDFPMPIFTREGFIPLVNMTDFKAVTILGFDFTQLIEA